MLVFFEQGKFKVSGWIGYTGLESIPVISNLYLFSNMDPW